MPIYEYRCGACGFQKEFLQRISDKRLTDCPECGKSTLSKMVTAAGFQLKGSGWYATDFKNNGSAKPNSAKPAENKSAETKSAETAETKSAETKSAETKSDDKPKKDDAKATAASDARAASA